MNFIDPLKTLIKKNIILTILSDYVISFLGFNFEKEYRIINFIKKKNPTIIDIGGNRGESIQNFLRFNKNLKIICFEPKKNSFEYIKKKYKKKNIRIFNFGIGNKQKKVSLYTPTIYNYEFSSLSATDLTNLKIRLNSFFKVLKNDFKFIKEIIKIKKLDKFNLKPDLIKIDAEGSELDILKSSIQTIKKYQPLLIIEFNQINFSEIKKILSRIGYKSYIFQNNTFSPIDKKLIKKIMKRDHLTNIVYTSKKRLLNFC